MYSGKGDTNLSNCPVSGRTPRGFEWRALLLFLALTGLLVAAQGPVTVEELWAAGLHAHNRFLPYQQWDAEYVNYFRKHYHDPELTLHPTAIVMHFTEIPTLQATWRSFARGGKAGHLSSHFIIDRDGTVYLTLPTNRRCRGAYGVNHVAISIEMVGRNEASLLHDPKLMEASFKLVEVLCRRYGIPSSRVWGHYQVAKGRSVVPDYTDYGDPHHPDGYPPSDTRTDPGHSYMARLWRHLKAKGI
ncbi:MAG: N-acetylmuramoyl-L-alanine amidase [Candidatus Xenobia bacterium]